MKLNEFTTVLKYLPLAEQIFKLAQDISPELKNHLKSKARENRDSWQGFAWRMINGLKYNQDWETPEELAWFMENNIDDHSVYDTLQKNLG